MLTGQIAWPVKFSRGTKETRLPHATFTANNITGKKLIRPFSHVQSHQQRRFQPYRLTFHGHRIGAQFNPATSLSQLPDIYYFSDQGDFSRQLVDMNNILTRWELQGVTEVCENRNRKEKED